MIGRAGICLALPLLLSLLAQIAQAAEPQRWRALADTVFHAIATDDTLPNGAMPEALAEDAQGFIWVGTQNGLARWDGYGFVTFLADPDRAGTLPNNVVLTLHRDDAGNLWVGTEAGGLARYDAGRQVFVPVAMDSASQTADVSVIIDDGAGGLWAGIGTGLLRVDRAGHLVAHLRHDKADPASLPEEEVLSLARDRSGALWLGGGRGLWRRAADGAGFVPVALPGLDGKVVVQALSVDGRGMIWAGTVEHGAFVIDPKTLAVRAVPPPGGEGASAGGDSVMTAAEIGPGEIWLGTGGGGILAVDEATLRATRIRHDPTLPTSLLDGAVAVVLRDHTGLAWVVTNHGVMRTDPGQIGILTVFGDHGRADGLAAADILSVLATPDGHVWAGSRRTGIDILDPAGVRVGHVASAGDGTAAQQGGTGAAQPGAVQSGAGQASMVLPHGNVRSMAAMPDGSVLIGTSAGLYRAAPDGGLSPRLVFASRDPAKAVWALRLINGVLWLGGPDGLWALRPEGGDPLSVLRHVPGTALSDPRVRDIVPGPDGGFWVGTTRGLNLVPAGNGPIETIFNTPGQPTSLSSNHITTLATDRMGRLWVGTLDHGLNLMVGRDGNAVPVFRRFSLAQGVPNASIDAVLTDAAGTIWASTDGGLIAIDPRDLGVHAYRGDEGVGIAGYFSGAGAVTAQGELVFGGMGGLTVVRPSLLAHRSVQPRVVPTAVRVGGALVPASSWSGLDVSSRANSLEVQFASLDLAAPGRLRYAYRLEGYDPDWIESDASRRVAAYTNLPPGRYMLLLRGSNRDGVWSDPPVSIPVHVLPAWNQTWWFRGLAATVCLLAIAALLHGRTLWMRQRQRALERQVAERTAELLRAQTRLREAAYADLLTGLANRRAFNEEFHVFTARAAIPGSGFVLLLVDLDGFKQVNDALGHDAGDAVLVAASSRLRQAVREGDYIARLGGDEFAVLLRSEPDQRQVEQICERLIALLSMPVVVRGATARIGASVGVAVFPEHGGSQELLFKSADLALYAAKRAGRGRACRFGDEAERATVAAR